MKIFILLIRRWENSYFHSVISEQSESFPYSWSSLFSIHSAVTWANLSSCVSGLLWSMHKVLHVSTEHSHYTLFFAGDSITWVTIAEIFTAVCGGYAFFFFLFLLIWFSRTESKVEIFDSFGFPFRSRSKCFSKVNAISLGYGPIFCLPPNKSFLMAWPFVRHSASISAMFESMTVNVGQRFQSVLPPRFKGHFAISKGKILCIQKIVVAIIITCHPVRWLNDYSVAEVGKESEQKKKKNEINCVRTEFR